MGQVGPGSDLPLHMVVRLAPAGETLLMVVSINNEKVQIKTNTFQLYSIYVRFDLDQFWLLSIHSYIEKLMKTRLKILFQNIQNNIL